MKINTPSATNNTQPVLAVECTRTISSSTTAIRTGHDIRSRVSSIGSSRNEKMLRKCGQPARPLIRQVSKCRCGEKITCEKP